MTSLPKQDDDAGARCGAELGENDSCKATNTSCLSFRDYIQLKTGLKNLSDTFLGSREEGEDGGCYWSERRGLVGLTVRACCLLIIFAVEEAACCFSFFWKLLVVVGIIYRLRSGA